MLYASVPKKAGAAGARKLFNGPGEVGVGRNWNHCWASEFCRRGSGEQITFGGFRSEEHTSEIQSQSKIGCRPLPEKKKKTKSDYDLQTRFPIERGRVERGQDARC